MTARSDIPHPGKWRTTQHNRYTDHEWIPDLVELAKRDTSATLSTVPDAQGVIVWDLTLEP